MRGLLEELFTAYFQDVYHYLFSLTRDAALSEDLAQDVFADAVSSVASFRGEASMKTWLFSIARNKWHSYLRKKNRSIETEVLVDFMESSAPTPEEQYQHKEIAERINKLLEKEPERKQRIVRMRLDGLSFFEIGEAVGISENAARVIDFRAKTKIRQSLIKEGYTRE